MANLSATIDGVEKRDFIDWKSLMISNVLTNQVDSCKFKTTSYSGKTYTPLNGREVVITHNGTRIFGGVIIKITQRTDDNVMNTFNIECVDYTHLLNNRLVNESYENQTVNYIVSDILTKYTSGFTSVNVDNPTVIDSIKFNYMTPADCFKQLADLTQYHWYVDYYKDIHLFAKGDKVAPVDIEDTTGVYERDSLIIRKDNRQIKNTVIVRGGKYLGDTFTAVYLGDGNQNVFPLTYEYDVDNFKVTVSGSEYDVGQEPLNNPDAYDILWNNESRLIRFRTSKIPNDATEIRVGGRPYLPVITKMKDYEAVQDTISAEGGTGEHEFFIVDENINSKEAARERAKAELLAYAKSLVDGEFKTLIDGFKAGQQINIKSNILNIDEKLIVNKVVTTMWTPEEPYYTVYLVTSRNLGIIEFLQKLLAQDKVIVTESTNELVDLVESTDDEMQLQDTVTASVDHNRIIDEMSLQDTTTAQSLNYDVEWVWGNYVWGGEGSGDKKRQALFDGSYWQ